MVTHFELHRFYAITFLLIYASAEVALSDDRPITVYARLVDQDTRNALGLLQVLAETDNHHVVAETVTNTRGDFALDLPDYFDTYNIIIDMFPSTAQETLDAGIRVKKSNGATYELLSPQRLVFYHPPEYAWARQVISELNPSHFMEGGARWLLKEDVLDLGDLSVEMVPVVDCTITNPDGTPIWGMLVAVTSIETLLEAPGCFALTGKDGHIRIPAVFFRPGELLRCIPYSPRTILQDKPHEYFFAHEHGPFSMSNDWLPPPDGVVWLPHAQQHYKFQFRWPSETTALILRGEVKGANGGPIGDFRLHLRGGATVDPKPKDKSPSIQQRALGSESADIDPSFMDPPYQFDLGPSTLYRRDYEDSDGSFELHHLQAGSVVEIYVSSATDDLCAYALFRTDDYRVKKLELILRPRN